MFDIVFFQVRCGRTEWRSLFTLCDSSSPTKVSQRFCCSFLW